MSILNPLQTIDQATFDSILGQVIAFVTKKFDDDKEEAEKKKPGTWDRSKQKKPSFILALACNPSFVSIAPARQRALLGKKNSRAGETAVRDFELLLIKAANQLASIASNQVERQEFFNMVRSPDQGISIPFTGPSSPGIDKLDQLALEHAENYEFTFMSSIKGEFDTEHSDPGLHLAILKGMGLWLWRKAEKEKPNAIFLDSKSRFECIQRSVNIPYEYGDIPIIWSMATEKLTSTTQMILLGLRMPGDDYETYNRVLENRRVAYFVECDIVDDKRGIRSLMLNYNKVGNNRKLRINWITQNIKDGLKSVRDNAIDRSLEILEYLKHCGCSDYSTLIEGFAKLAVTQSGGNKIERRLAFHRFAESHRIKPEDGMPPDYFELPLIFTNVTKDIVTSEIFEMCNYLGWWWTKKCEHNSQDDSDIRNADRFFWDTFETSPNVEYPPLQKLFDYLDDRWLTERTHKELRDWSRGRTIGQIISKVRPVLKKEHLFNADDTTNLKMCWPSTNSWQKNLSNE